VPADADFYADWADAVAMAQGKKLAGKPEELVKQALDADPKNRKALALPPTRCWNAARSTPRSRAGASCVNW
jgi:cytochrome c-type biogenesis protein CcmH